MHLMQDQVKVLLMPKLVKLHVQPPQFFTYFKTGVDAGFCALSSVKIAFPDPNAIAGPKVCP